MTLLSVNINKVALLRNSREGNFPDVTKFAIDCEAFGAQGITVHPRPDQRHIRFTDVYSLKEVVTTEFNIEGYPNSHFLDMVCEVKPDQCTLVPDPPYVLTSSSGWDTIKNLELLKDVIARLKEAGCRVSLFLNADESMVESAALSGADRIELYTGKYAQEFAVNKTAAVDPHVRSARLALEHSLGVNAGHDLNLVNLPFYASQVPGLQEVSIGHALVADALYYGVQNTIGMYRQRLNQ